MKGMQVIEVIFILIIMIIVTVVLVNMFTEMMGSGEESLSGQLNDIQKYHQGREAYRQCSDLCNDFKMTGSDTDAINYCKQVVSVDVNGDGVINDIDKGTFAQMPFPVGQDEVCEEHIYCPMLEGAECKYGSRSLTMKNCMSTLCRFYSKNGLTQEESAAKINQLWKLGACDISEGPNWAGWIGPLCETDITLDGADGSEQPGDNNNGGDNNGGDNNGGDNNGDNNNGGDNNGGTGTCADFCENTIDGTEYVGVSSVMTTCFDDYEFGASCFISGGNEYLGVPITSDADDGTPNPCADQGYACCCLTTGE